MVEAGAAGPVGVETGLRLLGGVVLLLGNAFFVTTEFAMTRVRQFGAAEFTGHPGLERAWEMTERLELYLSSCQVGITVCSVGLGVVAEPAVTAALGLPGGPAASAVVALAGINLLHVVVGEQVPTYLGVERTRWVARHGARPLYWWARVMWPVIVGADRAAKTLLGLFGVEITRSWVEGDAAPDDDSEGRLGRGALLREIGETLSRGGIDPERRREVLNALAIGDRPVESIMVPREEMVVLSTANSTAENLDIVRETPQHTRFPLVDGSVDEPLGFVYAPVVLSNVDALRAGDRTFADVAVDPLTVPTDCPVSDLIDRLQAANQEIALVVDPDRRWGESRWVRGLVTDSEALESIAGDLADPLDVDAGDGGETGTPPDPAVED